MAINIRQTHIQLIWNGTDVTRDLSGRVQELRFSDRFKRGQAQRDEVAIRLDNGDYRFVNTWWPETGSVLQPAIVWDDGAGAQTWALGTFAIDQHTLRRAPHSLTVQALSQTAQRHALDAVQTRSWEQITLAALAQQIATESGLRAQISAADIPLQNLQQRQESAHALLGRLAKTHNRVFAIKGEHLLLTGQAAPTVHPVSWVDDIIAGDLKTKDRVLYTACTIQYYDAERDQLLNHTERASGVSSDRVLNLYTPATDLAEAQRLAQAALADANQTGQGQGSLVMRGQPIAAGEQIDLQRAGRMGGIFTVREAIHTLQPGWTTHLTLERTDG